MSFTMSILFINVAQLVPYDNQEIVEQTEFSIAIPLFMYGGFLNLKVVRDLLVRFVCWMVIIINYYNSLEKLEEEGQNTDLIMPVIFSISMLTLSESFFYANLKAKAKLFLKLKYIEMQQIQYINLFDQTPEKVLICYKKAEGQKLRLQDTVYRNKKMKNFLGVTSEEQQKAMEKTMFRELDAEFSDILAFPENK